MMYIGKDLEYNFCTNDQFGTYSICVHDEPQAIQPAMPLETQSATPPETQQALPPPPSEFIQSDANLDSDDGIPGWAIAIIVLLCLLLIGGTGYFAFRRGYFGSIRRKLGTSNERQSNIYTEAFEDSSSQYQSRRTNRVKNSVFVSERQPSVASGWSKAPDSIEHASYGSKFVDGTNRISRDPSVYLEGRNDWEPAGYLHGQKDQLDPGSVSTRGTKTRLDPDSVSIRSTKNHASHRTHFPEEPIDP